MMATFKAKKMPTALKMLLFSSSPPSSQVMAERVIKAGEVVIDYSDLAYLHGKLAVLK